MTQLFSSSLMALALLVSLTASSAVSVARADEARPNGVRCFLGAHGDAAAGGDRSGWTCVPEHRGAQG
ncbi:MAG: hypothetical protein ACLP8A_09345 [Methylovirgula sp.]